MEERLKIVKSSKVPKLLVKNQGISPFGAIAKMLRKLIMVKKNHTSITPFVFLLKLIT